MDQGQMCILNWNLPSKKHTSCLNSLFLLTLGIPGKALTAEDTDPETKCQNTCGQHEICQINHDGILCKCRPGYGRNEKTDSVCESKNFMPFQKNVRVIVENFSKKTFSL